MSGRSSIVSVRMCAPSLRQGGRNGFLEEEPHVPAVAAARSFQSGWNIHAVTRLQDGRRIFLPMRLVEIGRQEETCLVAQHRIDAHDEVPPGAILARKMPTNCFIGDGKEASLRAIGALDLGLLADARRPLVGASGLITAFSALAALEPAGINVLPTAEKRAEQGNLSPRWRTMMDGNVFIHRQLCNSLLQKHHPDADRQVSCSSCGTGCPGRRRDGSN